MKSILYLSCAACTLLSAPQSSPAADIQEYFAVNTSVMNGLPGSVDLSFNPGLLSGTQMATATVTGFASATIDSAHPASNTGHASGSLPGSLRFDNGTQFNDAFTPVTFGSSFNFMLTLSGPAVSSPDPSSLYGSVFTMALFSTDGSTPLVTSDGILATLDLAPGTATATPRIFSADVSITPVVSQTPEPSTAIFSVGGLLTAFLLRVRRAKSLKQGTA